MATTILPPLVRVGGVTLALALSAGAAMAQLPGPRRTAPRAPPPVTTEALPRDLVAVLSATPKHHGKLFGRASLRITHPYPHGLREAPAGARNTVAFGD